MLTLDVATHTYRLDGEVVPSVTQILAPLYSFDRIPPDVLERKSAIGVAVHSATELIDIDDLDESTVDPAIVGYLDAYRQFLADEQPEWIYSEQQFAHRIWRFAGTLDRFGRMRDGLAMLDLKTVAELSPAVGPQTAAYEFLRQHHDEDESSAARFALQLKPNGRYVLQQYRDADDARVFASLLSVHHWRSKHGI